MEDQHRRFEICYVHCDNRNLTEIPIPDCDDYRLSGDNAGGLIVTAISGKKQRSGVGYIG
ncbi:hypothetical protein [Cohnella sp. 56]|uniref:hypothetical protein n=1 Tax=Cohnella sp. 56 TaxID=3113722 RepID=UPI0030E8C184